MVDIEKEKARQARNTYHRAWRQQNAEHFRNYQNEWRREHRETVREYEQRYWLKKAAELEAAAENEGGCKAVGIDSGAETV